MKSRKVIEDPEMDEKIANIHKSILLSYIDGAEKITRVMKKYVPPGKGCKQHLDMLEEVEIHLSDIKHILENYVEYTKQQ